MKKTLCILLTSFILTFVNGQEFDSSIDFGHQSSNMAKISAGNINHYFPILIFKDSTTKVGYDMINDTVICQGDYLYAIKEMSLLIYSMDKKNVLISEIIESIDNNGRIKDCNKVKKLLQILKREK